MFSFNFYSSLLLPAFFQGIIFTVLLLIRWLKEKSLKDFWLAVLILLASIRVSYWMLGFAGWYDMHDARTVFMFYFPFSTLIVLGPSLYLYFLYLTNANYQLQKKDYLHLGVIFAWIMFSTIKALVDWLFYYPFPVTNETQFGCKGPISDWDKGYFFTILSYVVFAYYVYVLQKNYREYKKYLIQNFSAIEDIQFQWLIHLIVTISAIVAMFLVFEILSLFGYSNTYKMQWIPFFFSGIMIYYVSIKGYFTHSRQIERLSFSIPSPEIAENTENRVEIPTPSSEELVKWKEKISLLMQEKTPYLNPELTLSELAKLLQTNTSLLSKMINEGFQQNFNDFINQYRLEAFVERLKNGEHKTQTLLSLAYDCGFNSKTTFNRAFKKAFSQAPKDFLETMNQ
ncbi:MAG: helix-turn-helix domain-containing protein [Bacteroidia bacterium]